MAGINIPQRKENNNARLFQIAGMAAGAASGGGPGAIMAGGQLGGMVGGLSQNNSPGPQPVAQGDTAMQRRMSAQQDDKLQTLRQAVTQVPNLPDPLRQEYAKPLLTAYAAEAKARGVNPWEGMG